MLLFIPRLETEAKTEKENPACRRRFAGFLLLGTLLSRDTSTAERLQACEVGGEAFAVEEDMGKYFGGFGDET